MTYKNIYIRAIILSSFFFTRNLEELKDRSWQLVGKVSKVYLYPIKSCAGIGLASAQATQLGLSSGTVRDR